MLLWVEDYAAYLEYPKLAAEKTGCHIHAYVLMTNHVHLLVTPMEDYGISSLMQSLGKRYVLYINSAYKRTGTLWEGRYKASLVDSECYLLSCMRYIELNPVRANMVELPSEYAWSSYLFNGAGIDNECVIPHEVYLNLGSTEDERCYAYRELFRHKLDNELLHELRETVNIELVFGREDFKDKIEDMIERKVRKGKPGRPKIEEANGAYCVLETIGL